jgi:hypothetical protein
MLGTELGAEGAGAKLRHTSDGRVYCLQDIANRPVRVLEQSSGFVLYLDVVLESRYVGIHS